MKKKIDIYSSRFSAVRQSAVTRLTSLSKETRKVLGNAKRMFSPYEQRFRYGIDLTNKSAAETCQEMKKFMCPTKLIKPAFHVTLK
ncbi:unnamed protein product [Moneuplotes crassus]|uniref:Uncharacterized protein n=1 Tax=Euplotes crassus TaxID=5936 RepID=A0AAD1X9F0_EUPCR|nr:unnamed protein product [Moneuplotes crassus]